MLIDIRKIRSEKRDLRNFGLTVGVMLGLLGGFLWWRGRDFYIYFIFTSIILIFTGLIVPAVLKPFQRAWMTIAVVIGWFMTRLILSILFFAVITPLGLIFRLIGKDFLDKKFRQKTDRDLNSYWVTKEKTSVDKSRYEKQF
jgi:hypothetical protein